MRSNFFRHLMREPVAFVEHRENNSIHMKIGVQLIAGTAREDILFQVAGQLERARPWSERRPPNYAGGA